MIEGPIKPASSSTPGAVPTPATVATKLDATTRTIEEGELIVNQTDARLFMKTSPSGGIYEIGRNAFPSNIVSTHMYPGLVAAPLSTIALTAGTAYTYLLPYRPYHGFTATALSYNVTTGGAGTADLALLEADESNNFVCKDNPVEYANGFSLASVATVDWTLTTPYFFSPGKLYYLAIRISSDATATMRAITPASNPPLAINIASNTQGSFCRFTATGISGGGSAEAPGGTSGRWFNITTWTHMLRILGNMPIIAPKL